MIFLAGGYTFMPASIQQKLTPPYPPPDPNNNTVSPLSQIYVVE